MKKRILLWVAWFLGVRKEIEPIIKEGTELYKKAEKKIKKANEDGEITKDEAKEIGHVMVDEGIDFAYALILLIKKIKK